jgi:hypothetical protein
MEAVIGERLRIWRDIHGPKEPNSGRTVNTLQENSPSFTAGLLKTAGAGYKQPCFHRDVEGIASEASLSGLMAFNLASCQDAPRRSPRSSIQSHASAGELHTPPEIDISVRPMTSWEPPPWDSSYHLSHRGFNHWRPSPWTLASGIRNPWE